MPPKISNVNSDPRYRVAMNMMGDLFLKSITRFSPLSKLPKLTEVDEKLKERALQAIKAKSPEDRKISVTKASELGPGNLWKGLDLLPQRTSKSPGNQQRLLTSINQSPLNPQQRKSQTFQSNTKIQGQQQVRINQNFPKKPLQRNHNRAAENNQDDSRNIGHSKQVTGNIVSQNLVQNQKSIRDDFSINHKSTGKKRKYSNENDKSLNANSTGKNSVRTMTQSRALHENKEKRVSFSPEKPKQHLLEKKEAPQFNKVNEVKTYQYESAKVTNSKTEPYVYVPPVKRVVTISQEKAEKHLNYDSIGAKIQKIQNNQQQKTHAHQSLHTGKEHTKKPITSQIKMIESKRIVSQVQNLPLVSQIVEISPKKVGFNLTEKTEKIVEPSFESKKSVSIIKNARNFPQSNVSQDASKKSKNPHKQEASYHLIEEKNTEYSAEQMRKDWSKIKQNLKYDRSLSPQNADQKRKISQRQDVALKMIASLFLDASTRYFPGLSMLLKRGISKEDIEKFRSKSSEFKINFNTIDRKSLIKPQPKTDRKLNWKGSPQVDSKHNNAEDIEKSNKKFTIDDFTINQNKNETSKRSYSIKESPEIFQREKQMKSLDDSKKNLQKIKNQTNKTDQVTVENLKVKPAVESSKVEEKIIPKAINTSKPLTSVVELKKQEPKSYLSKIVVNQDLKQQLIPSKSQKTSINTTQLKFEIKSSVKQSIYSVPTSNKKQQSTYVYQPPAKREQTNNLLLKQVESIKPTPQSINSQKQTVETVRKPEIKTTGTKQNISKQLMQSKSQPNIFQVQKPIATQLVSNQQLKPAIIQPNKKIVEEKKNVNSGQNSHQNSQIKPNPKPYQPSILVKDISILPSKSQSSFKNPSQQIKIVTPKHIKAQQQINSTDKKDPPKNQSYAYKPSIQFEKRINTQSQIPTKIQTSPTLKTVQSQKTLISKKSQSTLNNPQPITQNKQQKQVTYVSKTQKTTETTLLSKKFCMIIALVIKKRLSQNYEFSLHKIQSHAKKQSEFLKHTSFLYRSLFTFVRNHQNILKRTTFKIIKANYVESVIKIIKQNKPVEENQKIQLRKKESAAGVIFWFLISKISSNFQPLRRLYLNFSHESKVKSNLTQSMLKVLQKRLIVYKKDSFKAIKSYKNQRQIVLKNFVVLLGKIKYSVIFEYFSTLANKDIKQLTSVVKNVKQITTIKPSHAKKQTINEVQKTLQKSKSQEVLPMRKSIKEETQITQIQRLSAADEAKLESKRKELERKKNDLEKRKQLLQHQTSNLHKDKRLKAKKNGELKLKVQELERQIKIQEENQTTQFGQFKLKSHSSLITQSQIIPLMTRVYAYLFQDSDSKEIAIESFLSDNQHCFQLPTNTSLMNEWKVIDKNAQLKRKIRLYEGDQPREKKIGQVLQEENHLMGKLLRSFVRERYIWEWVNIIAHE